ncbi:MAG: DNA topoisomerase, partial [Lachnospiraceae bacterium]|nr:DNA topoisomerase [Lachnospiraceae bacterium]
KADKKETTADGEKDENAAFDQKMIEAIGSLKKGMEVDLKKLTIKDGETSPPKRYNSGSMILAMENAGQLIEEEELRAQIKGSGIGTSATRAEILSKLVNIRYLKLNKKTQIITPELLGEMVYDVVDNSIRSLLNPELTASWELGLTQVAEGQITEDEYMDKLNGFITRRVDFVKHTSNQTMLRQKFDDAAKYYKPTKKRGKS